MKLSKRLETVISFVEPGSRVADVGCDHGFVPIALVTRGIASRGIAMDVRPGPLGRAQEHVNQYGLQDQIACRLSDGVSALMPGEADTVIIAGMGGELVIHILKEGMGLWPEIRHWILSPQSELFKVRRYLEEHGFHIKAEDMILEDGKYYTVMDVVFDGIADPRLLTDGEALYGPRLIADSNPVLKEFLGREETSLLRILAGLGGQDGDGAVVRRQELSEKVDLIRDILIHWDEKLGANE